MVLDVTLDYEEIVIMPKKLTMNIEIDEEKLKDYIMSDIDLIKESGQDYTEKDLKYSIVAFMIDNYYSDIEDVLKANVENEYSDNVKPIITNIQSIIDKFKPLLNEK